MVDGHPYKVKVVGSSPTVPITELSEPEYLIMRSRSSVG